MKTINVLFVEDSQKNLDLVTQRLKQGGFALNCKCVARLTDFSLSLKLKSWDVILCSDSLVEMNPSMVLESLSKAQLDIPVVILHQGKKKDIALSYLRVGAQDCVSMESLDQLELVLRREFLSLEVRRKLSKVESTLHITEKERSLLVEAEKIAREEAEKLSREAQRANRMKDEFLATISHELRTPLHAILGWIELLRNDDSGHIRFEEGLDVIYRNTKIQVKLIDELFDLSHLSAGHVELNDQPLNFNQMIAEVVDGFNKRIQAKNLLIHVMCEVETFEFRGDNQRIQQAIYHLIDNSIKFTPFKGEIFIRASTKGSVFEFSVEDSGEGFDTSFQPFIFDKFRQEDSRSNRVHGGLGIGLGIVREIIEAHGGQVFAASPGKGKGATFTLQLPKNKFQLRSTPSIVLAEPAAAMGMPIAKNKTPGKVLNGVSVLVIDDAQDSCLIAKMILEKSGARVDCANSAAQALERLNTQRPDVIFCDINMPEMDGYEFIKILRSRQSKPSDYIPAAAFTAHLGEDSYQRSIESGYDEHLSKPLEMRRLVSTAAKLCNREID